MKYKSPKNKVIFKDLKKKSFFVLIFVVVEKEGKSIHIVIKNLKNQRAIQFKINYKQNLLMRQE